MNSLRSRIRLLRQAIFGRESRMALQGEALPPQDAEGLLEMLRTAIGLLGTPGGQIIIGVEARGAAQPHGGQNWPAPPGANGDGSTRDFAPLREQASRDDIAIEIEPDANGLRLAWSLSLRPVS